MASYSQAEEDFRQEVRSFIATHLPDALREKIVRGDSFGRDDHVAWQKVLAARGWLVPGWPVAQGGTGWSLIQTYIFEEELALAGTPPVTLTLAVGPKLVGPILCSHGTEAQKALHLPRIRDCSDWWCQGYSEPDAGSDLASLRTRAVRDGDGYVITGAKVWTSFAHWANRICVLARTDPEAKPQAGISFFLVDMSDPGVSVRPIRAINGRHFFNEVRLEGVRVSAHALVGGENAGWSVAKDLLEHERLGAARVAETRKMLALVARLAARRQRAGKPLSSDRRFRERLALLSIDALAIEQASMDFVARIRRGEAMGPEIALLKLRGTEIIQGVMDLACDVLGTRSQILESEASPELFTGREEERAVAAVRLYYRGTTIAAGTSEVQRNLLARRLLPGAAA